MVGLHPRNGLLLALLSLLAPAACSLRWDEGPPPRPLLGAPPDLSGLPRLNHTPAGAPSLIRGDDGYLWAAFCEVWRQSIYGQNRGCTGMRLQRLTGPPAEEYLEADQIEVRSTALYLLSERPRVTSRQLHIHRAGRASDKVFLFPTGPSLLLINDGGTDNTFLYWVLDKATRSIAVRRESGEGIDLPIPDGAAPDSSAGVRFFFSANGEILVIRDGNGMVTARPTTGGDAWPLGKRPDHLTLDLVHASLLSVEDDGLRALTLDGKAEKVLAPVDAAADDPPTRQPIDPASIGLTARECFFRRGPEGAAADLYRVPLDGSAAPSLAARGVARLLALPPGAPGDPRVAISSEPATKYAGGAGDAWVEGVRLVERGRQVRWSGDGKRLGFLEHAAHAGTYGELQLVEVPPPGSPAPSPLTLGLNVHQWSELGDGRLLAVENHVQAGSWNRLVIIERQSPEGAGGSGPVARWVAPGVDSYLVLPGGKEVLADVVSGASGYDLYRVPIPAP